jgi:hypothetical protein
MLCATCVLKTVDLCNFSQYIVVVPCNYDPKAPLIHRIRKTQEYEKHRIEMSCLVESYGNINFL